MQGSRHPSVRFSPLDLPCFVQMSAAQDSKSAAPAAGSHKPYEIDASLKDADADTLRRELQAVGDAGAALRAEYEKVCCIVLYCALKSMHLTRV